MPGRQRVTYEVACLFLLLWACLIGQQVVVVSARVRGNTTHLLQIRDRFRLFACCLLSFPAHGPSWDGGSWRGLHSASAGVALFESFFGMAFLLRSRQGLMWNLAAFLDRNPPPSCFLYSSPVSILEFLFVEPPGLMLSPTVGDTTCSTSLQNKKQRQKRYFLLGGCRNLNTLLSSVLLVLCFRISPVLAGSIEFSGGFWQPSSLASAPQVGFMSQAAS